MPTFPREKVESPGSTDFYFVEVADPDKAVDVVRRMVCERIPAKFGFDRMDDVQVLSPMQRGTLGCRNLNTVLQEALNSTGLTRFASGGPTELRAVAFHGTSAFSRRPRASTLPAKA